MRSLEAIPVLICVAIGAAVMWAARGQGVGSLASPGAGLMPLCLGAGLTLASLAALFHLLAKKEAVVQVLFKPGRYWAVAGIVFVLLGYCFFLELLGYLISTAITVFLLFLIAGCKLRASAVYTLVSTLVTYFFFTYLGLRLPPGILIYLGL